MAKSTLSLVASNQDPVSAGQRFSHSTKGGMPVACLQKESHYSFCTCYSQLSKNSSQSLSTFVFKYLQQKKIKPCPQGLNAIRNDQSLAWNSLKQLKNDFLLYGKFYVTRKPNLYAKILGYSILMSNVLG